MDKRKREYIKRRNTLYNLMFVVVGLTLFVLLLMIFGCYIAAFIGFIFLLIFYNIYQFKFLYLKSEFKSYYRENLSKQINYYKQQQIKKRNKKT